MPEEPIFDWPDKSLHMFTERTGEAYEAVVKSYSQAFQTVLLRTVDKLSVKKYFTAFCDEDQAYIRDWEADDLVFSGKLKVEIDRVWGDEIQTKSKLGSFQKDLDVKPVSYELTLKNRESVPVTDLMISYYVVYEIKSSSKGVEGRDSKMPSAPHALGSAAAF